MRRVVPILALFLAGAGGCPALGSDIDGAIALAPGASAELKADEAHLLLVVDTLDMLENLRFVPPGGHFATLAFDRVQPGVQTYLLRIPAGRYCLANFHTNKYRWQLQDKSQSICFDAIAGELDYAGVIVVRAAGGRNLLRWEYQPVQFLARMVHDHPAILEAHAKVRSIVSSGPERSVIDTTEIAAAAFEAGDNALGIEILERAANAGDGVAMMNIGARYLAGEGLAENPAKAIAWLLRANEKDIPGARRALCIAYGFPELSEADKAPARALCEGAETH